MEDWQTAVAAGLGGSPVAAILIRWGSRSIRRAVKKAIEWVVSKFDDVETAIAKLSKRIDGIEPLVTSMNEQLKPNGGLSIFDRVRSIQEQVLIGDARGKMPWDASAAWYECDAEGSNKHSSPALCEMWGMSAEEMSGSGWTMAIISTAEREKAWMNWKSAVEMDIPYDDVYTIRNRRTKEVRRVRTFTKSVKNDHDDVIRYFGVVVAASNDGETSHDNTPPVPQSNGPKSSTNLRPKKPK